MFEAAVQENILVNEMLWQELPEEELEHGNDIKVLDDELDECIKETATKRKKFPRKICGHVAKTMKAEREKLKLQQAVTIPKRTLQLHLEQVTTETELMENASIVSQEMNDIMKVSTSEILYILIVQDFFVSGTPVKRFFIIQNSAARVLSRTRLRESITLILARLHRESSSKILVLAFKALHSLASLLC
uniref:Uncharacterized protein n=1 Tax=Callorhinchus milii TaxID=7868 RepID=A0A4W3IKX7_CALMI